MKRDGERRERERERERGRGKVKRRRGLQETDSVGDRERTVIEKER